MHLMSLVNGPQTTCRLCVRTENSMSTRSLGKVFTRSTNVRAGTVVAPGASILAPIQHVIPSSRLVADRRSRPSSVASSTFPRTGSVLLGATARATLPRARDRFSWRQETFMVSEPLGDRMAVKKYTTKDRSGQRVGRIRQKTLRRDFRANLKRQVPRL